MATVLPETGLVEAGGGRRRIGRRTEGDYLCVRSGHVLSETAGAQRAFGRIALNSFKPPQGAVPERDFGASIDGEDRVSSRQAFLTAKCGSNLLSGAGFAQLRGQAQVVA